MKYSKKIFTVNIIIALVLQVYLIGINYVFEASYEANLIRFAFAVIIYIFFFSISMRKYLDFTRKLKNPMKKWLVIIAVCFALYALMPSQIRPGFIRLGFLYQIAHGLIIVFIISNHMAFRKYNIKRDAIDKN